MERTYEDLKPSVLDLFGFENPSLERTYEDLKHQIAQLVRSPVAGFGAYLRGFETPDGFAAYGDISSPFGAYLRGFETVAVAM